MGYALAGVTKDTPNKPTEPLQCLSRNGKVVSRRGLLVCTLVGVFPWQSTHNTLIMRILTR